MRRDCFMKSCALAALQPRLLRNLSLRLGQPLPSTRSVAMMARSGTKVNRQVFARLILLTPAVIAGLCHAEAINDLLWSTAGTNTLAAAQVVVTNVKQGALLGGWV